MKVACSIKLTHDQIVAWLKSVCRGDPADVDFQRKIIETFINSVYVSDDKIVIIYNVKGGKQVSYLEVSDALDEEFSEDPEGENGPDDRFDVLITFFQSLVHFTENPVGSLFYGFPI